MIVEIQDVSGKCLLRDDFQKMPSFGEIFVHYKDEEYEVLDAPVRHECVQYGTHNVWVPVVTVRRLNPSKTTKKAVKG